MLNGNLGMGGIDIRGWSNRTRPALRKYLKQSGEVDQTSGECKKAPDPVMGRGHPLRAIQSDVQRRRKVTLPSLVVFVTAAGGVVEPHFETFAASR